MSDDTSNPDALEDEEYEADLITLEDEAGVEHTFEVLDAADIGEGRYLAMVPYSEDPAERLNEDAQMLIMRIGEENGEEYLDIVDDEEELHTVGQAFIDRLKDVYDIDLEELERQLGEGE